MYLRLATLLHFCFVLRSTIQVFSLPGKKNDALNVHYLMHASVPKRMLTVTFPEPHWCSAHLTLALPSFLECEHACSLWTHVLIDLAYLRTQKQGRWTDLGQTWREQYFSAYSRAKLGFHSKKNAVGCFMLFLSPSEKTYKPTCWEIPT